MFVLCFIFSELGNGWTITTLRSEVQKEFVKVAMAYAVGRNWTYFIGGNNDNSTLAITNINEGRSPQIQTLSPTQKELMGVLCEMGKMMKTIFNVY